MIRPTSASTGKIRAFAYLHAYLASIVAPNKP
jgi:hypothetical protein